ncbi:ribosomal protein S18-alanine N-acetyltransferase [Thiomicrospira cyclica]|uniref:Ribosomal-protein-alanine acetyltransferase n=1 Tax=Thiomicrospira cyclica (strain DSM 14477 / JCM 11371 / ALM1) TaxID=717773 RepID=F6D9W7_THICA|nr:ribosomal protein S18-alanine N-acetyltransferase [Thiomicrospira cyclica]AEG31004.1 ribosomal-protein-alanine acetyltransferase [Thiomicrospira cyclica ALM1]
MVQPQVYVDLTSPLNLVEGLHITPMFKDDLDAVVELEQQNAVAPWRLRSFELALNAKHCNWVICSEAELIGFICASQVLDELHILNLSVAQTHRGQGLATAMIKHLCTIHQDVPIRMIFLEVRESNKPAQKLYRKLGFKLDGVRKGYYQCARGIREDALLMSREF